MRPILFVLPGLATAHPGLADRYELVAAPLDGRRRSLRVVAERTWLAREAARRRLPLVHHAGGTAPPLPRVSAEVVLSMHDIQYVAFPHYFTRLKLEWLRREVPAGLARARVVTTPSEFVRGSLGTELGVAPERVQVVPHGLPPASPAAPSTRTRSAPATTSTGRSSCTRRPRTPTRTTCCCWTSWPGCGTGRSSSSC